MKALRRVGSAILLAWGLLGSSALWAQAISNPTRTETTTAGSDGPQQGWHRPGSSRPVGIATQPASGTSSQTGDDQRGSSGRVRTASNAEPVPTPAPERVPTPEPEPVAPGNGPAPGDVQYGPSPEASEEEAPGPERLGSACSDDQCEDGPYCEDCDPCDLAGRAAFAEFSRHITLFGGVEGFKGPLDRGLNGNFGFHEGLNWGDSLGGPCGFGYQVGCQAVQSDFRGNMAQSDIATAQNALQTSSRDQVFVTAGLFRRACEGLQGGVVIDFMHDRYFAQTDVTQIRSELSYVFDSCNEIGYWGTYALSQERVPLASGLFMPIKANDIFAAFYRRQFCGNGQGRLWGGATANGDGVIGGDATLPLGDSSWAIGNSFTALFPKQGTHSSGLQNESWSVAISLVWYPGRSSRCANRDCYQPLLDVSDNSTFLIHRDPDQK